MVSGGQLPAKAIHVLRNLQSKRWKPQNLSFGRRLAKGASSTNAQIEFVLRRALAEAGRLPGNASKMRGRGRPPAREAREAREASPGGDSGPLTDPEVG